MKFSTDDTRAEKLPAAVPGIGKQCFPTGPQTLPSFYGTPDSTQYLTQILQHTASGAASSPANENAKILEVLLKKFK